MYIENKHFSFEVKIFTNTMQFHHFSYEGIYKKSQLHLFSKAESKSRGSILSLPNSFF